LPAAAVVLLAVGVVLVVTALPKVHPVATRQPKHPSHCLLVLRTPSPWAQAAQAVPAPVQTGMIPFWVLLFPCVAAGAFIREEMPLNQPVEDLPVGRNGQMV
jgi:hypothetical protein